MEPDQWQLGKTKVFVKSPESVNADLVPYLLELLERDLIDCDKPSATKAIIAESLKLMAKDLANGEKVCVCVCYAYCERTKDLRSCVNGYLSL